MQWLMAHMWMALSATGVLGLLFGWAVRGLRLNGKLRRAEGERNIALGALNEKESQLEAMFSAGRGAGEVNQSVPVDSGDSELRGLLQEREVKLQSLSDELARSKAELSKLRESAASGAPVATGVAAGLVSAAATSSANEHPENARLDAQIDTEDAALQWRNRYLESRVRMLQGKVQDLGSRASSTAPLSASPPSQVVQDAPTQSSGVALAKLKWQNDYLRQRMAYLEKHGASEGVEKGTISAVPDVIETTEEPVVETNETSDQELAKLRWRNRYLEGRLAYYEGDKGQTEVADSGVVDLAKTTSAMSVGAIDLMIEKDSEDLETPLSSDAEKNEVEAQLSDSHLDEDERSGETLSGFTDAPFKEELDVMEGSDSLDVSAPAEANGTSDHAAESHGGIQPLALDNPVDGEGDDLTAIGGIGPKINEVLNGLGIYHFDQIAAWTPENIQWVDDHLSFEGRIKREQWVEQAAALSDEI